jgi:hypothetical protein
MRAALLGLALVLALATSAVLFYQSVVDSRVTPEEIAASAPEDLLGLGFAFFWAPFLLLQIVAVVPLLRASPPMWRRAGFLALSLFLVASFVSWRAHVALEGRVLPPSAAKPLRTL